MMQFLFTLITRFKFIIRIMSFLKKKICNTNSNFNFTYRKSIRGKCHMTNNPRIMIRRLFAITRLSRIMIRGLYAVYTQNIRINNYTRIIRCLYVEYTQNIRIINYTRIIRCLYVEYTLFICRIYV
jgi:hypothetical protein